MSVRICDRKRKKHDKHLVCTLRTEKKIKLPFFCYDKYEYIIKYFK